MLVTTSKSFVVLFFKKELLPSPSFGEVHTGEPCDSAGIVRLGVHSEGTLPSKRLEEFDVLLSVAPDAPAPWVSIREADLAARVASLRAAVESQPVAAAVAAQVLPRGVRPRRRGAAATWIKTGCVSRSKPERTSLPWRVRRRATLSMRGCAMPWLMRSRQRCSILIAGQWN
jgi:hypothetical protein